MKNRLISAAVAAALVSVAYVPAASAQGTADLEALKAQLQALQAKVEEMEKAQKAQTEAQDRTTDMIAQQRANVGDWVGRFTWKGDLRYRNEQIKQEFVASDRDRDRIRLRAGFFARVNDTLRVEVQMTTDEAIGGNGDARSSNVTLSDANSRKRLDLDLAYGEWTPTPNWKATFGKMRYPWIRPAASLFFDGDINPEGASIGWQQGATNGLFVTGWWTQLAERSAMADTTLAGAQVGWRGDIASGTRLTLAAAYFDHGAAKGYNGVQNADIANAFGNTTSTSATLCRPTITACIANDFNVVEAFAELTMQAGGYPLTFFADYAKNNKADLSPVADQSLDTAYTAGVQFGRVANAHSWEVAYLYENMENDALYGQWIDSDFAGGVSGSKGHVFRFGYGFARNFRINGSYFLNDNNIDVPATIAGAPVFDRKYRRLQLDLNMSF